MTEEDHKPSTIKVFIAAPVTDEVVHQLKENIIPLKKSLSDKNIRWGPRSNYHITLAFIGNVPEQDIPLIEAIMTEAAYEIGLAS